MAQTRHGALIEVGSRRWLVGGAPPMPPGATLSVELGAGGREERSARLLAIRTEGGAERALEPPLAVRLQPASAVPAGRPAIADAPRLAAGIEVDARPIGPSGRPVGPPVRLSVAGLAMTDALGQAAAERAGQQILTVSGPQSRQIIAGAGATKVVGRDRAGRPLLEAAGLRLRLETPLDLPAGGRLQLLLPQGVPWPRAGGLAPAPDDRAVQALLLRQPAPGEPRERDGLRLPAADHALAARLLRWIEGAGASASGAAAAPESEPDAPLPHAPTKLGRQTRESQPGCWRVLLLPLGFEDPIPLRLYLRDPAVEHERHPRPQHDRDAWAGRAIFEVELSRLGRCQLDVLCQAARFDVSVRSAEPLAAGLQDEIRSLVRAASELAGWAGRVEFRIADLLPLPEARGTASQQITA